LGRYPAHRKGPSGATDAPLAKALDAVQPGVAPSLALGRAATYQTLADQLRALHPDGVAPAPTPAADLPPIDQSEQGFILWQRVEPQRARRVRAFETYLRRHGISGVAPTYQLLRTASDWRTCGGEPFATPPPADWPHMALALAWIRQRVKPAIGAVEAKSSFRDPELNACALGAKQSAHLDFWAVDLEPLDPTLTRARLMNTLCAVHKQYGAASQIGLGFYAGVRFHIDAKRYRHWGFDPVAAPTCAMTQGNERSAQLGGVD
jgi:hypothetical protein